MAAAPPAAAMAAARFFAGGTFPGAGCGESGKFLAQFGRATVRTFRSLPVGRPDQDFAVALALLAMKFVDWHAHKLVRGTENSRRELFAVRLMVAIPPHQSRIAGVLK